MFISSDTNIWIDFFEINHPDHPFLLENKYYLSSAAYEDELLPTDEKMTLVPVTVGMTLVPGTAGMSYLITAVPDTDIPSCLPGTKQADHYNHHGSSSSVFFVG